MPLLTMLMPIFESKLAATCRISTAISLPTLVWRSARQADRPVGPWFGLRVIAALGLAGAVLSGCQTTGMGEDESAEVEEQMPLIPPDTVQAAEPGTILLVERALDEGRLHDAQLLLERYVFTFPEDPRGKLAAAELRPLVLTTAWMADRLRNAEPDSAEHKRARRVAALAARRHELAAAQESLERAPGYASPAQFSMITPSISIFSV